VRHIRIQFADEDVSAAGPFLTCPTFRLGRPRHTASRPSAPYQRRLWKDWRSSAASVFLKMSRRDDDLAYGDYHGQGEGQEGDRGLIGDVGRRFFGGKNEVCAFTGQGA
jgi:hypothetical protein